MRQYQGQYITIARIFLFLSIVRFVLAAPVVVREVHGMHVNVVGVAEDGAATSQKRWDDWLANVADQTRAPTTPRLPDSDHFGLHSPRSSTNNAPSGSSGSALSTGPHPRPRADSPPRLPDHPAPEPSLTDSPHPSDNVYYVSSSTDQATDSFHPSDYAYYVSSSTDQASDSFHPSDHAYYVSSSSTSTGTGNDMPTSPTRTSSNDASTAESSTNNHPPNLLPMDDSGPNFGPQRPTEVTEPETKDFLSQLLLVGSEPSHALHPAESHPAGPETELSLGPSHPPVQPEKDLLAPGPSHPVHPALQVQPETGHSRLGSEPSHLAEPETKNFLSQIGSESAGPSHVADLELETKDVLGLFLKGKIKRRISGSGAVNPAGLPANLQSTLEILT